MDFLLDPTVWIGLLTLVVLEIVLGIDNLVFVAILTKKVAPEHQNKALYIGLGLALFMRLCLLSVMSWLVGLTEPIFSVWQHPFSFRDLILMAGGLFLLAKATMELHERLEDVHHTGANAEGKSDFWMVIAQILVLDAVFSLDSIITAVGMVDNLPIMMAAVVVAMIVMIVASRPLTTFVNEHPTVIVLCLSFLLMIGLSLVADGLGMHIPKGYLYAAIGFSIMIESFNQVAKKNSDRNLMRVPFRERTTSAIVRLMSKEGPSVEIQSGVTVPVEASFEEEEKHMVEGVLTLAERNIKTIMTPRADLAWINIRESVQDILEHARNLPHSSFPVCDGSLDNVIGVLKAKDLIRSDVTTEELAEIARQRQPLTVPETVNVLRLMRDIKASRSALVLVTDEFGVTQGIVTPHDLFEAIAGDFPDEGDKYAVEQTEDGWIAEGTTDLILIEQMVGIRDLADPDGEYVTLAGLLLDRFEHLPKVGESYAEKGWVFEVLEVGRNKIERIKITPQSKSEAK